MRLPAGHLPCPWAIPVTPTYAGELLRAGHLARYIINTVEQVDLGAFHARYARGDSEPPASPRD